MDDCGKYFNMGPLKLGWISLAVGMFSKLLCMFTFFAFTHSIYPGVI